MRPWSGSSPLWIARLMVEREQPVYATARAIVSSGGHADASMLALAAPDTGRSGMRRLCRGAVFGDKDERDRAASSFPASFAPALACSNHLLPPFAQCRPSRTHRR